MTVERKFSPRQRQKVIVSCFAAQPVQRTTITVKLRGPVQASVSG